MTFTSLQQIQDIAACQRRHGVEIVEARRGDARLRIVVRATGTVAQPDAATSPTTGDDTAQGLTVRSTALGVARLRHPSHAAAPAPGTPFEAGEAVMFLELRGLMSSVDAPRKGRLVRLLAEEGQRVDYGQALFLFLPDEE